MLLALTTGFEWEGRLARLERELEVADVPRRVEVVRLLASYPASEAGRPLLRALEDPDATVRREAATVAGQIRLREALPLLLEWLEDPDVEMRAVAAGGLGRLRETAAMAALVRALGDAEASVRRVAVRALAELDDVRALVPILGRLDDLDPDVRVEAAQGLARLGDARAVVPLVGRARDDSIAVRRAVVTALGALGDARAVPTLTLALRDDDEDVRLAVMTALGHLGDERAATELAGVVLEGESRAARTALAALGAIGGRRTTSAAVDALASGELRGVATEVLLAPSGTTLTLELAERLAEHEERDQATALATIVLQRLARQPAPDSAEALLRALERGVGDPRVVLQALAQSGAPAVLVPLLTSLESEHETTQLAALDALDAYFRLHPPDGRAADPLLTALGRVPVRARVRVVRLLGVVGASRATNAIRPLLDSQDPLLRLAAVESLGALGDPRGADVLEPLLDADEAAVRHAAARALGAVADDDTVMRLAARLEARTPTDRHAVLTALERALARGVAGHEPTTLASLELLTRHPNAGLASAAVWALGRWTDDAAAEVLRRRALETSFSLRHVAALALARHPSDESRRALRSLANDELAPARLRAAAVAALGPAGDASDLVRLAEWTTTLRGPVAAAASFGLAQRARLSPEAPIDDEALCRLLRRRDAYVRANVLSALASRAVRCERTPGELLGRSHAEVVRAAAARWSGALEPADEARARCAREDLAPAVARACAAPTQPALVESIDVHAFGGDGRTRLRDALVAIRLDDGSALVAWTDAEGRLTWPHAPAGPIQLDDPLRVPLQP